MFLLVPAYPGSPGQKAVKRLFLLFYTLCSTFFFITLSFYLVGKWHKETFSRERRKSPKLVTVYSTKVLLTMSTRTSGQRILMKGRIAPTLVSPATSESILKPRFHHDVLFLYMDKSSAP